MISYQNNSNLMKTYQHEDDDNDLLQGLGEPKDQLNLSGIKQISDQIDFEEDKQDLASMQTPTGSTSLLTNSPISKKLLDNSSVVSQMQGEFSIIKGYGGSMASLFAVGNAHQP